MGCLCTNEPGQEDAINQRPHIISNNALSSNRSNNRSERSRQNQNADVNEYYQRHIEPYLQSLNNPDFNFKEVEDQYCGEGLKKMKGYICPIPKEELVKIRKAFWETRIEGNKETWQFLRQICEDPDFQHGKLIAYINI